MSKEKRKTIILEIDPPVDEKSKRRMGFYERVGFLPNSFDHIHPPYHNGIKGHELVVMSYPDKLSISEYDLFFQYLKSNAKSLIPPFIRSKTTLLSKINP